MDLSFKKAIIKAVDRIKVTKCDIVIYRTKSGYISGLKNDTYGQYNYIMKIEGKKVYTELLEKPKVKVETKKKSSKDKDISDMQEASGN